MDYIDALRFNLDVFFGPNRILKIITVVTLAALVAYALGKLIAMVIVKLTQLVAVKSDAAANEERFFQLRRIETYLSVMIAVLRFAVVVAVVMISIELLINDAFKAATVITASTVFIVLGAATLGPLLRDITIGATMIVEQWYNVGDFIRVEPFLNVKGVVERVTLRSTKIRDISGEVIWMHNQHVQAVAVTPRGRRSSAIDIFVDNIEMAKKEFEKVVKTLRPGPTMLVTPLHIVESEQISDNLWRITIVGETAPGREWMIEDFFVNALKAADKRNKHFSILYGPLVRYADEAAERRFRRAVRVQENA